LLPWISVFQHRNTRIVICVIAKSPLPVPSFSLTGSMTHEHGDATRTRELSRFEPRYNSVRDSTDALPDTA
jgi:hypothetical protein